MKKMTSIFLVQNITPIPKRRSPTSTTTPTPTAKSTTTRRLRNVDTDFQYFGGPHLTSEEKIDPKVSQPGGEIDRLDGPQFQPAISVQIPVPIMLLISTFSVFDEV